MTLTTRTINAVGAAGTWTASSGDLAAALQSLDGEYAISGATSDNMYLTFLDFSSVIGSDTINSITVRVRARTSATGQPTGQMTVGHRSGGVTTNYNVTPGSGYTQVANDGAWAWYDYPYSVHPVSGDPWVAGDLPGSDWDRLYVRFYDNGGAPIHIDRLEVVVDHGAGGGGTEPREGVVNDMNALYVGSTPVDRVYIGEDVIWENTP